MHDTPSYLIGYGRTSTVEQEAGLSAQRRDLLAAGCRPEDLYLEQVSAKDKGRPKLEEAIRFARRGDALVVTRLDRLARSVADLIDIQARIEEKGATLRVLNLNLDTSTPTGKLMVNMLISIAQFERELMLERQREGIAAAKDKGLYKGRVPTATRQRGSALRLKSEGKSVREIMADLKLSRASVYRLIKLD